MRIFFSDVGEGSYSTQQKDSPKLDAQYVLILKARTIQSPERRFAQPRPKLKIALAHQALKAEQENVRAKASYKAASRRLHAVSQYMGEAEKGG